MPARGLLPLSLLSCAVMFFAATLTAAETATAEDRAQTPDVPLLPPDEVEFREVIDVLKQHYANPELLQDAEIGRAALQGVIDSLGANASMMTGPSTKGAQYTPIKTEVLPNMIGYLRVPSFAVSKKESWKTIARRLKEWQKGDVIGVVLDLRDFQASGDFQGVPELASLFLPPNQTLFTIQGLQVPQEIYNTNGSGPLFTKPLAIVTNGGTRGASEALAASLRHNAGALIVGQSTAGQAAKYSETKLSTGRYLRMASGEVALADGTRLFGHPVAPDVPLVVDASAERKALTAIHDKGARGVVKEWPRRQRMSEAALVREENPELDAALARNDDEDAKPKETFLQDAALMRAMDALRVIEINRRHLEAEAQRDTF